MQQQLPRVAVLTVTYGKRWNYLSQVVEAVMKDSHVISMIIVDNGSSNKEEIEKGIEKYGDRVTILRLEKNVGSAGGFAHGIEYVRGIECEYILMLDDDNVPEDNAISMFMENRKAVGDEKVIVVGNRTNIPGNESVFYSLVTPSQVTSGSFFEVLGYKKIKHFLRLLFRKEAGVNKKLDQPRLHVPNESFVYGGAFIPIEAIREAPLPDKDLVLYGDDIEYSWGIKRLGYSSYVCYSPKIYDIEMSFGEASQVLGLFDPKTALFKVYYRIRNMIRISVRNTNQFQVILFINILVWVTGLFILAAIRYGIRKDYFRRVLLVIKAIYGGYIKHATVPIVAQLP